MVELSKKAQKTLLKSEYLKLSSFIRSLYNHIELEYLNDYAICKKEMQVMSKRLDKIILEIDAFEQTELGMK